mgnify:CR=1 FL=1
MNVIPSGPFSLSAPPNLRGPPLGNKGSTIWKNVGGNFAGASNHSTLGDNDSYAQGITNGTASLSFPLRFPADVKETSDDIGISELTFACTDKNAFNHELTHRYQLRSISRMNNWLRTTLREEYANEYDMEAFFKKWMFVGVPNTNLWDQGGSVGDNARFGNALTLHVDGRVRVRDIWLSVTEKAEPGDSLWLIVYKCEDTGDPFDTTPEIYRWPNDHQDTRTMIKKKKKIAFAHGPNTKDNNGRSKQYWQILPWVGKHGDAPKSSSYITMHWAGRAMKIGVVEDRYGNQDKMVETYRDVALDAVSPNTMGSAYRALLQSLPEVTIQLNQN